MHTFACSGFTRSEILTGVSERPMTLKLAGPRGKGCLQQTEALE